MFPLSTTKPGRDFAKIHVNGLDRTLGTGKQGTKLKIAGAQTLFFFSDIINLGWVVASAKKNDYKFLPVCSSWRCQLKRYLPGLAPSGWDGTPGRQKYPSNLLQPGKSGGDLCFQEKLHFSKPSSSHWRNVSAEEIPSKRPPLPRPFAWSSRIRHGFTATK